MLTNRAYPSREGRKLIRKTYIIHKVNLVKGSSCVKQEGPFCFRKIHKPAFALIAIRCTKKISIKFLTNQRYLQLFIYHCIHVSFNQQVID